MKNPKVGDIFFFGLNNGKRIFWKVLRIQDRMALIISSYNNLCNDNNTEYKTPGGAPTTFCENKKQIAGFIGTVKNIL